MRTKKTQCGVFVQCAIDDGIEKFENREGGIHYFSVVWGIYFSSNNTWVGNKPIIMFLEHTHN